MKDEIKKRKAAERKAADLEAKLKFANKNRFGDKSHRSKKKSPEEESDRTQDKDDFDGTSSSLPENSMANKGSDASAAPTKKRNHVTCRIAPTHIRQWESKVPLKSISQTCEECHIRPASSLAYRFGHEGVGKHSS